MPLTPEQQQELAELRRLDELDAKFGGSKQSLNPTSENTTKPSGVSGKVSIDAKPLRSALEGHSGNPVLDKTVQGIQSGGVGPGATAIGETLSAPAKKLGDFLMQRAVGMKKIVPGLGQLLGKEGVIGTKGMMQGQVESGLASRGKEIGELTSSIPSVSSDVPAQKAFDAGQKLVQKDAYISPQDMPQYRQMNRLAEGITERGGPEGSVTGEVAQNARSNAGQRARQAGAYKDSPSQVIKAKVASTEQAGWSQALKDSYAKANPTSPDTLANADAAYGALSSAQTGLSKQPNTLLQLLGLGARASTGAAVGGYLGGSSGAKAGGLAGLAAGSPLVQSTAARALMGRAPEVVGSYVSPLFRMLKGNQQGSRE